MNPFNYYTAALKNYTKFDGRANRSEFGYFILFNIVISYALVFLAKVVNFNTQEANPILSLYRLAVLVPTIAIIVRRFHDFNKSGWWALTFFATFIPVAAVWIFSAFTSGWFMLILFVPVVVATLLTYLVWLAVLVIKKSTKGANSYGEESKA